MKSVICCFEVILVNIIKMFYNNVVKKDNGH